MLFQNGLALGVFIALIFALKMVAAKLHEREWHSGSIRNGGLVPYGYEHSENFVDAPDQSPLEDVLLLETSEARILAASPLSRAQ